MTDLIDRLEYWFRRHNVYFHWGYWQRPGVTFRFNSSLMYGASPYKSYHVGPIDYRRYL